MANDLPDRALLVQAVLRLDPSARLIRAWPLEGGVSAQVLGLEIERPDGEGVMLHETLVLRRHGARDLAANREIAATEYRLLQAAHARGLPVSAPHHLDTTGTLFPTPWLELEYLPGAPIWAPADPQATAAEMARQMARIHAIAADDPALPALPDRTVTAAYALACPPATLDHTLSEGEIRAALSESSEPGAGPTRHWPPPERNPRCLLHGDIWPGNILWQDGAVTGILDWSEAGVGDPITDLGNSRLELAWTYGEDAMVAFTETYLAITGYDAAAMPWWDLIAALKPAGQLSAWIDDPAQRARMRVAHRRFTERALVALAAATGGKSRL